MPLVCTAGYFFLQMVHLACQVLLQVIHGRDLLGDFAQVVAFRGKWHTLEMSGPRSILSCNLNKLMRDLVRAHR